MKTGGARFERHRHVFHASPSWLCLGRGQPVMEVPTKASCAFCAWSVSGTICSHWVWHNQVRARASPPSARKRSFRADERDRKTSDPLKLPLLPSVSPSCYSFLPAFSSITWSRWVRVILSRSFLVSPFFWHLQNSLPNSTFLIIFGTPISNILGHCAPLTLAYISQAFDRGHHFS